MQAVRRSGNGIEIQKRGLLFYAKEFSEPFPVFNISKGGTAFSCSKRLSRGTKLAIQLLIPGESPLSLNSIVRRRELAVGTRMLPTGIEFMPFGEQEGMNEAEKLDILRKLDEKYGGGF